MRRGSPDNHGNRWGKQWDDTMRLDSPDNEGGPTDDDTKMEHTKYMHVCIHAHMHTYVHAYMLAVGPIFHKFLLQTRGVGRSKKNNQKEDAIVSATWKALGPMFDKVWLQKGGVWEILGP